MSKTIAPMVSTGRSMRRGRWLSAATTNSPTACGYAQPEALRDELRPMDAAASALAAVRDRACRAGWRTDCLPSADFVVSERIVSARGGLARRRRPAGRADGDIGHD